MPLLTSITTSAGTTTITYTPTPASESLDGTGYYTSSGPSPIRPRRSRCRMDSARGSIYDGFGRLTKTTLLDGSAPVTQTYDATGLGVTTTFADGSTFTNLYGPFGEVLESTDGAGNAISYNYGPNLLLSSILAPDGVTLSQTYNSRMSFRRSPIRPGQPISFAYDTAGRVVGMTDGDGNTVRVAYDSNSNPTSLTFPDGTQTQLGYNAAGVLDQVTGRDGAVTSYTLNANDLPTQVSYSDGTTYTYTYDSHGDLLTSTDAGGTTTYAYDACKTSRASPIPPVNRSATDTIPRGLTQESDQSGVLESFTYDANSRLFTVSDALGHTLVVYTYDDLSRVSMESFGNGTNTVYSYDADGNVASIINLAPDGAVSNSLAYTYNWRKASRSR